MKGTLQKNTAYWIARIEHRTVPIEQCVPHPRNPREHPPEQISDLRASYRRFGQFRSLVGIENGSTQGKVWIAAGCGTLQAMNEEHAATVDVGFLPPETPPDVVEGIMIADNNLSSKATDNGDLLAALLEEQKNAGYDLASMGSDEETLRQMLESAADGSLDRYAEDDTTEDEEEHNGAAKLRFEPSRAGGAFAIHDLHTWDDARIARFKAWKEQPDRETAECEHMAEEIGECIRELFGQALPPLVLTVPPRGKTEGSTRPYAVGVLASRVAALLGVDLVENIARTYQDTTANESRSRHSNLRDSSEFVVSRKVEHLTIVLDDVTTTGSTFERVRAALAKEHIPNILMAYVVWHTRLEAPNSA